jgi:hypothetical protein
VANDSDFIKQAIDRFNRSVDAEVFLREEALISQKFADGDQWPSDIKQFREENNLPCLTINLLNTFIKGIVGDVRQNMPSIKVRPVDNKADPAGALVRQELIRHIENNNNAKAIYANVFEQALDGCYGYLRIRTAFTEADSFDQDIVMEAINNKFRVYFDQSAQLNTYEDAKFAFITATMSVKEFRELYPKKSEEPFAHETIGEAYEGWFEDDKMRLAEYYWKEPVKNKEIALVRSAEGEEMVIDTEKGIPQGFTVIRTRKIDTHKVMWAKISGAEVIEGPVEIPSRFIPIVPFIGDEKNIEGLRKIHSLIYHAIDSQRMYNYNYTKEMERLGLAVKAKYLATKEQINGHDWNSAHTSNRPVQTYTHVPGQPKPEPIAPAVSSPGLLTQMSVAKQDIKETTGIFESNMGKAAPGERSGVLARERRIQGESNTFKFIDNFLNGIVHTGKVLLDMMPRVFDTERIIRVTGEESDQIIQINKTIIDPQSGEEIKINDLSSGKYDYIPEAGAYYLTKRQETVDSLQRTLQFAPDLASIIIPMIAEKSDWPGAKELGVKIEQLMQAQQQAQQTQQPPQASV